MSKRAREPDAREHTTTIELLLLTSGGRSGNNHASVTDSRPQPQSVQESARPRMSVVLGMGLAWVAVDTESRRHRFQAACSPCRGFPPLRAVRVWGLALCRRGPRWIQTTTGIGFELPARPSAPFRLYVLCMCGGAPQARAAVDTDSHRHRFQAACSPFRGFLPQCAVRGDGAGALHVLAHSFASTPRFPGAGPDPISPAGA